ncbi:C-GCAxxG-C-C family protein [Candidatus Latescibacterota bacterium]
MTKSVKAAELFENGYACSQSVLAAYADDFGLDRETALKISGGFGGGMGGMGKVCGALTGAFMVIGLKHRGVEPGNNDAKQLTAKLVSETAEKFIAIHGSINCSDLLGCDFSTAEGKADAQDKGLFDTLCPKFVRDAADILEELL